MSEESTGSRSERLDRALAALLTQTPEIEAAAVVSFDGLPMASALPAGMDEDRVAAMSAALLSLGERAAQGLGRGELSQVYIEGETGTVYLVSCDDEAVLVAVAAQGAKVGMMLYEVRRTAAAIADALRDDEPVAEVFVPSVPEPAVTPFTASEPVAVAAVAAVAAPVLQSVPSASAFPPAPAEPVLAAVPPQATVEQPPAAPAAPTYVSPLDAAWQTSSYAPTGSDAPPSPPGTGAQHWS